MKYVFLSASIILIASVKSFAQVKATKKVPGDTTKYILVEGGTFMMGSEVPIEPHEKPVHKVTVGSFYMGETEVTFREYDAYCDSMGEQKLEDRGWGRGNRPVISVSWSQATNYCNWLSKKEKLQPCYIIIEEPRYSITLIDTANGYRLPTEAEWEFAARGGNKSKGFMYAGNTTLDDFGWFIDNSQNTTHPVKQKQPNELGLYDMNGNVWEWCWDFYDSHYYSISRVYDPKGPESGRYRSMRGGAWYNYANYATVTARQYNTPDFRQNSIGFRVVRSKR